MTADIVSAKAKRARGKEEPEKEKNHRFRQVIFSLGIKLSTKICYMSDVKWKWHSDFPIGVTSSWDFFFGKKFFSFLLISRLSFVSLWAQKEGKNRKNYLTARKSLFLTPTTLSPNASLPPFATPPPPFASLHARKTFHFAYSFSFILAWKISIFSCSTSNPPTAADKSSNQRNNRQLCFHVKPISVTHNEPSVFFFFFLSSFA